MQPHHPYQPYPQQNPYAPPGPAPALYRQNVFAPYGATAGPLVKPTLRNWKLGLGIAQVALLFLGIGLLVTGAILGEDGGQAIALAGGVTFGVWYLLILAYTIVNMVWLYQFWSWIPPDQRYTSMWKKYISPGAAVGFMFIPYFNIYWMFVMYLGLADIMERMRVQYPTSKGPAKTLAILTIVIPMFVFPAAPIMQYLFAKHLEAMATDMHARMVGRPV